ncbi:MAG: hypothetical protein ABL974_04050 [Prosthecobacter sp.]
MNSEYITLLTALRANEGLIAAIVLCMGPALLLSLIGFVMRSGGASLRPIVFIAVLFLPIVVPFFIGQLVLARTPAPMQPAAALAVTNGKFTEREKLFGAGIPAELIREAKSGMSGILDEAEVAEVGITMSGETVLIAQFSGEEETKRAGAAYHRSYQLQNSSGDEEKGWRATRMQGDYIEMLRTGRQLFVWSGLTQEAAATRRAASDLAIQFPALKAASQPPLFPALQPLAAFFAPVFMKVISILLLVFIYTLWFFKGAGWASSSQAVAGAPIMPESDLVSRLMSINDLDVPFSITRSDRANELIADWRYADAKWIDLARAHGMRKTFRIKLTLDESAHTVRATDYISEFDWSVGRSRASIQWKAAMGLVFFQKEQQTVFGLQLDDQGHLKPVVSYTYKFDLNEMKSPIMTAITKAGWTWRPTAWQGPVWLRWLTE